MLSKIPYKKEITAKIHRGECTVDLYEGFALHFGLRDVIDNAWILFSVGNAFSTTLGSHNLPYVLASWYVEIGSHVT